MSEDQSQQGQHRETTLNYVDLWLDHLDVSEDHRVRGLARKLYDETEHRASAGSFAAGLTYLVTQCDSDYQHVSQREVAEISGFSRSTIQTHYQEIARQWNERDDDLVTDGGRAESEKRIPRELEPGATPASRGSNHYRNMQFIDSAKNTESLVVRATTLTPNRLLNPVTLRRLVHVEAQLVQRLLDSEIHPHRILDLLASTLRSKLFVEVLEEIPVAFPEPNPGGRAVLVAHTRDHSPKHQKPTETAS